MRCDEKLHRLGYQVIHGNFGVLFHGLEVTHNVVSQVELYRNRL